MIKHDKIQHGKIQVGDTILDAEIDMEVSEPPKTTIQATGSLTSEGLTEALDALLFDHEPDDISPPVDQSEGDSNLHSYVVIAENSATAFAVILYLDADNEQDVRELTMRYFLRTDHGVPTKYTVVPLSEEIEEIVMSSNDEEMCSSLGISYE